ncbi:hypothetical protein [Pseudonocardia sp. Ae707_Ps1]|uniref:hypothetical protein n=1 Tax=Pseudonocardia sp. Ae707_Ps1 TaxID=1885572 RepID=UPI00094B5764|nr:hypothetical protein [Pseudonocardia sp. Ae707_Ps1]
MGALFVLLRRLRLPAGQVIGVIAINVVISFTLQGISWQGHLSSHFYSAGSRGLNRCRSPRSPGWRCSL